MKALFITTQTVDCANHVRAWNSIMDRPADHLAFDHMGLCNDWQMPQRANEVRPDVMFYIGAHRSRGNPKPQTLIDLRGIAPLVLICSDAADHPWHPVLGGYRGHQCFDLMVAIDGAREAPVDLATLTPVDERPFRVELKRDIRCGFSGSVGRWNARSETINALEWFAGLVVRRRETGDSYDAHARFMKRCRLLLNVSLTGSQQTHHVKGRVVEAGFAGCALLESAGSPIGEWLPDDCYLTWRHPRDVKAMIEDLDDATIDRAARRLAEEVRARYTARTIYGEILRCLHVDTAEPRPAA